LERRTERISADLMGGSPGLSRARPWWLAVAFLERRTERISADLWVEAPAFTAGVSDSLILDFAL